MRSGVVSASITQLLAALLWRDCEVRDSRPCALGLVADEEEEVRAAAAGAGAGAPTSDEMVAEEVEPPNDKRSFSREVKSPSFCFIGTTTGGGDAARRGKSSDFD